jgi:hypothetical protein
VAVLACPEWCASSGFVAHTSCAAKAALPYLEAAAACLERLDSSSLDICLEVAAALDLQQCWLCNVKLWQTFGRLLFPLW